MSTLKSSVIYSFRRTIIAFTIISMLIIACIPAFAEGGGSTCKFEPTGTAERDGIKYETGVMYWTSDEWFDSWHEYGNYAAVIGYEGNAVELTIPSEIDGYQVFCINEGAFENAAAANEWLAETFG